MPLKPIIRGNKIWKIYYITFISSLFNEVRSVTVFWFFNYFSFVLDESKPEPVIANALTNENLAEESEKIDKSVLIDAEEIKSKCLTNLVACHFQLSNHRQVVSLSTELLSKEEMSKNVKLLYRRGVSNLVCTVSQHILTCIIRFQRYRWTLNCKNSHETLNWFCWQPRCLKVRSKIVIIGNLLFNKGQVNLIKKPHMWMSRLFIGSFSRPIF